MVDRPEHLTNTFQGAWNAHDVTAFGALFHADATFVNRFATYWRGGSIRSSRGIEPFTTQSTAIVAVCGRRGHRPGRRRYGDLALLVAAQRGSSPPGKSASGRYPAADRRDASRWRVQAAENVALTDPRTGREILATPSARNCLARTSGAGSSRSRLDPGDPQAATVRVFTAPRNILLVQTQCREQLTDCCGSAPGHAAPKATPCEKPVPPRPVPDSSCAMARCELAATRCALSCSSVAPRLRPRR